MKKEELVKKCLEEITNILRSENLKLGEADDLADAIFCALLSNSLSHLYEIESKDRCLNYFKDRMKLLTDKAAHCVLVALSFNERTSSSIH